MNIKESNEPWKHWIIDDFLNQKQVKILQDFSADYIREHNTEKRFELDHLQGKERKVLLSAIKQMPKVVQSFNYQPPRKYKKLYPLGHLAVNPAGFSWHPHTDYITKIWTFVTYIGPVNSIGTYLMSNKAEADKIEIPWKPGRCLVFAGSDDTWHSYLSGNNWRSTITAYLSSDKDWQNKL